MPGKMQIEQAGRQSVTGQPMSGKYSRQTVSNIKGQTMAGKYCIAGCQLVTQGIPCYRLKWQTVRERAANVKAHMADSHAVRGHAWPRLGRHGRQSVKG